VVNELTAREDLSQRWKTFSENECHGYSPLYEQITRAVSENSEVLDFLLSSPLDKLHPNLLLAAVHDRVLQGLEPKLFDIYYNNLSADVGAEFVDCVLRFQDEIAPILATRFVQTNEIGRVSFLAPALASLQLEHDVTLIDVGTSAGLTLARDFCFVDYGDSLTYGPMDSTVRIDCSLLRGVPPLSRAPIARQIGFDRNPIDTRNVDDYRWMQACVWPDTGRTERTNAALELARTLDTQFVRGDAIKDLPALLESIDGPLVVTTSWALVYLPTDQWSEFSEILATASERRPVSWISAEAQGVVTALPTVPLPEVDGPPGTVLGAVEYRNGAQTDARVLAHVHSHGKWMWWYD
jgi:hypothetical protein